MFQLTFAIPIPAKIMELALIKRVEAAIAIQDLMDQLVNNVLMDMPITQIAPLMEK